MRNARALGSAGRRRSCPPSLAEGGLQHLLLGQVGARDVGDDLAVAHHVDVVAVVQLFDLGGVPDEGAPRLRLGADQLVDLQLGADIDAAHRVVHQDDAGIGAERAGEQHLLLVAAGERQDVVVDVRRLDADALPPFVRQGGLGGAVDQAGLHQRAHGAHRDVARDRPEMQHAVILAVAGDQGDRARDGGLCAPLPGRLVDLQQQAGLAMAGQAGKADDFALVRDQRCLVGLLLGQRTHDLGRCAAGRRSAFVRLDARLAHRRCPWPQPGSRDRTRPPRGRRPRRRPS